MISMKVWATVVIVAATATMAFSLVQTTGTPQSSGPTSSSVAPEEDAIRRSRVPHKDIATSVFVSLGDAATLISHLPAWAQGHVPNFDSKWTEARLAQELGRPLTSDEAEIIRALNVKSFGFRTVPTQVGASLIQLNTTDRIFELYGPTGSWVVRSAGLTKKLIPEVEADGQPVDTVTIPPAP